MISDPIPLEESDPWLAEQFRLIVQGKHHVVEQLYVGSGEDVRVLLKPRKPRPLAAQEKVGRNDPCPCKSGKKFKHCCGR